MSNLDVLKMILLVDKLRKKARRLGSYARDGQPFKVDEGAVVDRQGALVYESSSIQPGDAEVIVLIYNTIGVLDWDDIHELVALVVDEQKGADDGATNER